MMQWLPVVIFVWFWGAVIALMIVQEAEGGDVATLIAAIVLWPLSLLGILIIGVGGTGVSKVYVLEGRYGTLGIYTTPEKALQASATLAPTATLIWEEAAEEFQRRSGPNGIPRLVGRDATLDDVFIVEWELDQP